jgi:hypothetical protein
LATQIIRNEAYAQERQKRDVIGIGSDEVSYFRAGQQCQISTGGRIAEIKLAELGCMNEGDERGSEQKRLIYGAPALA